MIRGLQPKPDRTEGSTEVWRQVDFVLKYIIIRSLSIGRGQKNSRKNANAKNATTFFSYKIFFKLLIGREFLYTKCKYHSAKKCPSYCSDQGRFFRAFALRTNASTNLDGCGEPTSGLCSTTTSTSTADMLIICFSQHQVLFDRQDVNY